MINQAFPNIPGILAGFSPEATDEILAASEKRQIKAKNIVMETGEPAAHVFMISSGRLRCYKKTKSREDVVLYLLGAGDVFGLVSLLSQPPPYMASAEALSDCELFVWTHDVIRRLTAKHPQLAENALRIALEYLQQYVTRHMGLVSKTAEQRLAVTLLGLSHRGGHVHPDGVEIEATNQQLSGLADISRFTTSRLLKKWAREGVVSKVRSKVVIHVPEAMATE